MAQVGIERALSGSACVTCKSWYITMYVEQSQKSGNMHAHTKTFQRVNPVPYPAVNFQHPVEMLNVVRIPHVDRGHMPLQTKQPPLWPQSGVCCDTLIWIGCTSFD